MFLTYDRTGDSLREQPVFLHAPRRWGRFLLAKREMKPRGVGEGGTPANFG